MKQKFSRLLLIRPVNCLLTFISVWVGAVIAGEEYISLKIIFASLSGFSIAAFGNIVNDIFDIKTDKINKPYRPLIAYNISISFAWTLAILFASSGIVFSIFVSKWAILIASGAILLLIIYTPLLKGYMFMGNLIIALAASLAFLYGGIAVKNPIGSAYLVIIAFVFHLGREMIKDLQDKEADIKTGKNTGIALLSTKNAQQLIVFTLSLLVLITLLPFMFKIYGVVYLSIVNLGVNSVVIYSICVVLKTDSPHQMRKISALLKASIPIGLIAVYLGSRGF